MVLFVKLLDLKNCQGVEMFRRAPYVGAEEVYGAYFEISPIGRCLDKNINNKKRILLYLRGDRK